MSEYIQVARLSELPDPSKRTVEVDGVMVVLAHVSGEVFCIDDVCTHDGGPLGDGPLCGFELACPRHGAKFDVRDGRALTMPATQDTAVHDVRVDGDEIWVRLREQ